MGPDISLSFAEQAHAIEAIKRTFARRLRCMDTKRWEVYPTLHTDDVVSETWDGLPDNDNWTPQDAAGNRVVGKEPLTRAIRSLLDGGTSVTTVHHGHNPEIELTSDTTATGIWAMEDQLWWTNGDTEEHLHGYGHYHEQYRLGDGQWLISYRKLTRLRVDTTPHFFDFLAGR
ncbi:bile-acid 7-alpha dehydratase [Mycobacterium sp. CBMA 234]|uniref:nuclear transport factor 2 family protein n=1 Tax=Mycolicibacterium sp. CBMA 234 TaxID=1918495 RepID=UPI0012DCE6EA|nr:nuclear transport factor 2 family protein [Mycolicibacterium sp. CBMA 234]MUL67309.1 bile-acid 7-alpha dehydratase [Mycolicibacterium sp. CBMA 234]